VYLGDDKVTVVEGCVMEVDEDIVVTELWDFGLLVVFEAVEAVLACYLPLLSC